MVGFNLVLAFCFMSCTVFQTVCIARMAILKKCVICFFSLVIFTEVLRSAVIALLCLHPKSIVILAPVCSGFSYMCSGQAKRYWFQPLGDENYSWVKSGNVMSTRITLLCWIAVALGHVFILEQPSPGKFADMPRWRFFSDTIAYATQCCFRNLVPFSVCLG